MGNALKPSSRVLPSQSDARPKAGLVRRFGGPATLSCHNRFSIGWFAFFEPIPN